MKKMRHALLFKLLCGILAGILVGAFARYLEWEPVVRLLATFASIFGSFLSFVIPLVIITFVAVSIVHLGRGAGKLLGITIAIAYLSTIIAGLAAFELGSVVLPYFIAGSSSITEGSSVLPYFSINVSLVVGVMEALVLAFILGLGGASTRSKYLLKVLVDFQAIVGKVISHAIIPLIPIYIAATFSRLVFTGQIEETVKSFVVVFGLIISLQLLYIFFQYGIVWGVTKNNSFAYLKNMLPAYFTAFGTQSSAATIPVTLECVEDNDVDVDICDFVVPLCATIHLAGDTITLVLSSMAMMYLNQTIPTFADMMPFIMMLGVTMIAAPGIPGGGVMAALGLLESMLGFNKLQQSLMIAVHFSQDSFGTATNVTGDGAIALIVNKFYKKKSSTNADASIDLETH